MEKDIEAISEEFVMTQVGGNLTYFTYYLIVCASAMTVVARYDVSGMGISQEATAIAPK